MMKDSVGSRYVVVFLILLWAGKTGAQNPGSGQTLQFNGVDQYVALNSSFGQLTFPMSLTTWYKPGTGNQWQAPFFCSHSRTGAYRGVVFRYINGQLNVEFGNGVGRSPAGRWGYVASQSFSSGRWYHIAVVMTSANNVQFYVDGIPVATTLVPSSSSNQNLSTNNSTGRIGATTSGSNISYLNGELDELNFWDKAFSQLEIREMMCEKLLGNESGLLASYSFDDGTGSSLSNRVSGGPNGNLVNSPSWVASSAPVGDRSTSTYSGSIPTINFSQSIDSIVLTPSSSTGQGVHLYFIDAMPTTTSGVNVPPGVNYYFGVFNTDNSQNYNLEFYPGPVMGTTAANAFQLGTRPHNASPTWSLTALMNNPNIILSGHSSSAQYIVSNAPCPGFDFSLGKDTTLCSGSTFKIGRPQSAGETYEWSTGASSDSITINSSGTYWLKVMDSAGCTERDSIVVSSIAAFSNYLPPDSTVCDSLFLTINGPLKDFAWASNGSGTSTVVVSSGQMWFRATDTITGCMVGDTMDVTILQSSSIPSISVDTIICGAQSFSFDATTNGVVDYTWYDGQKQAVRSFSQSGAYWVERSFSGGCKKRDTVSVVFSDPEDPLPQEEYYMCDGDSAEVELPSGNYQAVIWSNGDSGLKTHYWQPGRYSVEVQNENGCWTVDSFYVAFEQELGMMQVFSDTSFCNGKSLLLKAPDGYTATWPNGSREDFFVGKGQNIRVEITDGCTKSVEFFEVKEHNCECEVVFPNAFTPNGDGLNEEFGPGTHCEYERFHLQVFNRFGGMVFSTKNPEQTFDGTFEGRELPIGVYLYTFSYSTPTASGKLRGHFTLLR